MRFVIAIVAALASVAHAQPTIELRPLTGRPIPEELGQQLRIYLADTATIVVGAPLAGASLQDRVHEVAGSRAELVIWLEQSPGPSGGGYIAVLVGKRGGRAVVDIGEVPPSDASGRLLALRIGAFLDETLTSGVGEHALAAGPAPPPPRWLALAIDAGRGELDEAAIAIAVGQRRGRGIASAGVVVRAALPTTTGAMPSLELSEQRVGAVGRIGLALGPWGSAPPVDVGVGVELDGERAHAVGIAASGMRAETTSAHLVIRATAEASWWLTRQVAVELAVGAEHGTSVERFLVEGQPLVTIGTLSLVTTAGIAIRFP